MKLRITIPDMEPLEVEVPGDQATVGRGKDCDVTVPSPYVSKVHVRLYHGLVAHDLGSINGTFVGGGEPLKVPTLVPDGRLVIGQDNVLIEVLDVPDAPAEDLLTRLRELQGRHAGLEHDAEELRNENAYLRLQVDSMRKAEATRSAVQELSKAQMIKEGVDFEEFERLQQSYTEVLERLQADIDSRLRKRESAR